MKWEMIDQQLVSQSYHTGWRGHIHRMTSSLDVQGEITELNLFYCRESRSGSNEALEISTGKASLAPTASARPAPPPPGCPRSPTTPAATRALSCRRDLKLALLWRWEYVELRESRIFFSWEVRGLRLAQFSPSFCVLIKLMIDSAVWQGSNDKNDSVF